MAESDLLTIHTDGGARGNPGPAAYAYVIEREGQPPIEEGQCLGDTTNNQAEYTALVRALEHALELGKHHRVVVYSDSELMVKQLNGEYKVKNEELKPLWEEALDLKEQFQKEVRFVHVRRAQNKRADELCNEALDGKRSQTPRLKHASRAASAAGLGQQPPAADAARLAGLHAEAMACLRAAGISAPEAVWRQLTGILEKHLRFPPG